MERTTELWRSCLCWCSTLFQQQSPWRAIRIKWENRAAKSEDFGWATFLMPRCNCSGRPGSAAWLGWGGRYFGHLASALQLPFSLCWHSRYRGKGVGYAWDCCQSRTQFCQMRETTDIFRTSLCFTRSYSVSSIGIMVIADSDITQKIPFLYIFLAPGGVSQQCCHTVCHVVLPSIQHCLLFSDVWTR